MSRSRFSVWVGILLALAVAGPLEAALATPSHARANGQIAPSLPGFTLGLSGAVGDLASGTIERVAAWGDRAKAVDAQIVRVDISWAAVAPSRLPFGFNASNQRSAGYNWSGLDQQVRDIADAGFKVLIQVSTAPTWAEGSGTPRSAAPGAWKPNAIDLGRFATALATRYDGRTADPLRSGSVLPRVSYWQAWNEPNLSSSLAPQWVRSGSRRVAESPLMYRNMENAFYASIKAVSSGNFVVGAGTAPYGDPPGGARMRPVTFDQKLFCLDSDDRPAGTCRGPVHMNAIDDHPYVSGLCCEGPTWHASLAGDTSVADMYKIVDVLRAAQKAGTVAPTDTKVWASEIGWNTDPPNPNHQQASSATQVARWATQALYVLWAQGVSTVLWYQLSDDPENPAGWAQTYTEGLYYKNGVAKPAAAALAFPFMTNRRTKTAVQAWGRSPRSGTLSVQERMHGRWVSVVKMKLKAAQVFEAPVTLTGRAEFRATVAGERSSVWSQVA